MILDLSTERLPPVYKKGKQKCYLDPVRKKLIYITPEETVRQKVISFLIDKLEVPADMINVEAHLSHYGVKSKRRADIIIHACGEDDVCYPIAIVECKASGIILGDKAARQAADYCDALGCDYAMLINDQEAVSYHYNEAERTYIEIECLPKYSEMIEGKYREYAPGEAPERIAHKDISNYLKENLGEYDPMISHQSNHALACAAFNLLDGLLDPRHRMPTGRYATFQLIEDYGVRTLSYGNAGGGIFNGLYRSFIIDVKGSTEMVSLGIATCCSWTHPDIAKTALNVAIDNERISHHALQLVLDDNVKIEGKKLTFYHHGRIGVSNKGSGKISELRDLVYQMRPQIVADKGFCLGSLVDDRLWHLDDPAVIALIENLITYALIRDDYRAQIKARQAR